MVKLGGESNESPVCVVRDSTGSTTWDLCRGRDSPLPSIFDGCPQLTPADPLSYCYCFDLILLSEFFNGVCLNRVVYKPVTAVI